MKEKIIQKISALNLQRDTGSACSIHMLHDWEINLHLFQATEILNYLLFHFNLAYPKWY